MEGILLPLALILLAAEFGAVVSERFGLTRVAGQIAAGLIIGPSLLGLVHDDAVFQMLAGVGALCILAIAGLETDLAALRSVGRAAILTAIGGVLLPFAAGAALVHAFGYDIRASLFCGAILTATSVGISAAALGELGLVRSRTGSTILGAAVIDDVIGLVVLGVVVAGTGTGTAPLQQFGAMAAVLAGAGVGVWLLRARLVALFHQLHLRGGGPAAMLGGVLLLAWLFQSVGGLAGITGAYLAGLAIAGSHVADRLRDRFVHAGETLFVPVFLVAIGLSADLRTVPAVAPVALGLLVVAVLGKLIGGGVGARLGGLDSHASLGVGIGMIARGEVALVAATLGRASGAIDDGLYAACILVALGTTVITPIFLSVWARRPSLAGFAIERTGVVGGAVPVTAMTTADAE